MKLVLASVFTQKEKVNFFFYKIQPTQTAGDVAIYPDHRVATAVDTGAIAAINMG